MFEYTFRRSDKPQGDAFELAVKEALGKRLKVSPAGGTDLRYHGKCYDVKQNGTVIQCDDTRAIKGSSRVLYATHIAYNVVSESEDTITLRVDLSATDMWVVDRDSFVRFLRESPKNLLKSNKTRKEVNIQTLYNYSKQEYHGKKGIYIEQWLEQNAIFDDGLVEDILDGYYNLMGE